MNESIEKISEYQVAGVDGESFGCLGVRHQVWQTPLGPRDQYMVTVPRPVAGAPNATERTGWSTLGEALAVWSGRRSAA